MHIVPLRDALPALRPDPLPNDEERLLRRDVLILQVEAARLRRKVRRQVLVIPA
jgi:hypothetical protein